jgi:hypothetical protein
MNGKELKRLSRRELVDIIYQLKKNEEEMQAEIDDLKGQLEEKRLNISEAGNIANAAVDITRLFSTAQNTADIYLREIESMKEDTEKECSRMVEEANKKVKMIMENGEKRILDLKIRYQTDYKKWQQLQAKIQRSSENNKGN